MAIGMPFFNALGGAVEDIFSADALRTKAAGNRAEAEAYGLSAELARQNKEFAITSTSIKTYQQQRGLYATLGQQATDVAAGGFEASGSALDLLRDSAAQGALTKAVLGQQGLIEQEGYEVQAKSYDIMRKSALMAADANERAAGNRLIAGGVKGIAAIGQLLV